jgi:hypothetical protein
MKTIQFIKENWSEISAIILYLLIILKVVLNMLPTSKNRDVLLKIIDIIDAIVPNKATHSKKYIIEEKTEKL